MSPNTFEILVNTSFAKEKASCQLSILADKHTQLACDILGMFLSYLFLSLASIYDKWYWFPLFNYFNFKLWAI